MTVATSPSSADSGLVRAVGRWALVAMTINGIIGAGIFGLPSRIHALTGPYGLLAFIACAVVIACIALCFAEVSSRFTLTGGPYLYVREAFGPVAGFLVGWLVWVTRVTALAVISNVMASYLAFFWPPAGTGWGRAAATTAVMASLAIINLVGVRKAAGAISGLTIGKLAPLLLFVGVGLFFLDPHGFALTRVPDAGSFSKAVLLMIFAFSGFEATVIAAGEMKDPRRDIPFALFVAIAVSTVMYVMIQAVCIGTLPGLAASEKPLADASMRFMGTAGGSVIALGALVSTMGTLCGAMLLGSRVLFAMSERNQIPGWLARTHPRFHTPHVAILITAGLGLALALTGTFTYLVSLSVIARLATYLSTAAALPVFRRNARARPALFIVPAGGVVVTLAIAACLWLLTQSGARELRDVGITLATGFCLYAAHRWWSARQMLARPPDSAASTATPDDLG